MAIKNMQSFFMRDFSGGVRLESDADIVSVNLQPNELLLSQNVFLFGGSLQKRKGMSKFITDRIDGANPVRALHRFYRKTVDPELLGVAGQKLSRFNTTTSLWVALKSGLTDDTTTFFTSYGPTELVFIANGVDAPLQWNGTTLSTFIGPPATAKQFIIHRERVFTYSDSLDIRYSDNLDPSTWPVGSSLTLASPDPVITGASRHIQSIAESSVLAQLLFFTANTSWILAGNDFQGATDILLQEISSDIGTQSPKSIAQTPAGTVFFGTQGGKNNVFLVVGEGLNARIIPIGDKIRRELDDIPESSYANVTALYHDGFYRLHYKPAGATANTREWWLKYTNGRLDTLSWWGPMVRDTGIRSLLTLSGSGDTNTLLGGGETGFVYTMDDTPTDDGILMSVKIQTPSVDFGELMRKKILIDAFININTSGGAINIRAHVDHGSNTALRSISFEANSTVFPFTFPVSFFFIS